MSVAPELHLVEPERKLRIMTISQAADLYLGELARLGRTPRTLRTYQRILNKLADAYPQHDVEDLTATHVRTFLDGFRHRKRIGRGRVYHTTREVNGPATLKQATGVTKNFFEWLDDEGVIPHDPAARIQLPKLQRPWENDEVVSISSEDVRLLLLAAEGWAERICVYLAVYTGARRHALAQARRSDYDPFDRTIKFHEKGGKTIVKPVADPLAELLDAAIFAGVYSEWSSDGQEGSDTGRDLVRPDSSGTGGAGQQGDARVRAGSRGGSSTDRGAPEQDPYLIPSRSSQRREGERDDRIVSALIDRAARRAGVKTTVHALRAAFAVQFLDSFGIEQKDALQQLLGHVNPGTTEHYTRRYERAKNMDMVRGLNWGLESTETLEAKDVAEKEGFEPSFDAKPHGNRVGIHRVQGFHEEDSSE